VILEKAGCMAEETHFANAYLLRLLSIVHIWCFWFLYCVLGGHIPSKQPRHLQPDQQAGVHTEIYIFRNIWISHPRESGDPVTRWSWRPWIPASAGMTALIFLKDINHREFTVTENTFQASQLSTNFKNIWKWCSTAENLMDITGYGKASCLWGQQIHPHDRSDDVISAAVNFAMVLTHFMSPPEICSLTLKQFGDSSRGHLNILTTHYIESEPKRIILVHWFPLDRTTQQGEEAIGYSTGRRFVPNKPVSAVARSSLAGAMERTSRCVCQPVH